MKPFLVLTNDVTYGGIFLSSILFYFITISSIFRNVEQEWYDSDSINKSLSSTNFAWQYTYLPNLWREPYVQSSNWAVDGYKLEDHRWGGGKPPLSFGYSLWLCRK